MISAMHGGCCPCTCWLIKNLMMMMMMMMLLTKAGPHSGVFFILSAPNSGILLYISTVKRYPVSILLKSISGRHRPVRVADGPMMARCRFT